MVKFARRNKVLVGGVAAFIAVLLFGLIRTSIAQGQAEANAARARQETETAKKNLLDFYAEAARRASQRGQHLEALDYYDKALDAGSDDPILVHLNRARALMALNRIADAQKEIEKVATRAEGGLHEGAVLLFQGEMALADDNDRAIALLRQALTKKLPPADETYARALVAENPAQSTRLLEQTLEQDRFHHGAHAMLGIALSLQGRLDEADTRLSVAGNLFPDDSGIQIAHALICARRGDKKRANDLLKQAAGQLPAGEIAALRSCAEALYVMRDWETMTDEQWEATRAQVLKQLMPLVTRLVPGTNPSQVLLRFPPSMGRGLKEVSLMLPGLLIDRVDDRLLDQMARSLQTYSEGLLFYTLGSLLVEKKRWAEAERAFLKAVETQAMFPCRRSALLGALRCEVILAWPAASKGDAGARRRALKNLNEFLRLGPLKSDEARTLVEVAVHARDYDLARYLLAEWERLSCDVEALRVRIDMELRAGGFALALATADRWIERAPADRRAKEYRDRAADRLRQLSKSL